MRLAPTSLRHRLLLGAMVVGLVFAVLFGALAAWRIHSAERSAVTAALKSRIELARDEVAADGSLAQDAGSPKTDLVQVLGPDGRVRSSSPALRLVGPLADVSAVTRSRSGVESQVRLRQPDADLATFAVPLPVESTGASAAGTGALVVATDVEGFTTATSDLVGLLWAGLVGVVLAIGLLAWWLIGRALRSVTRLTESAEDIRPQDGNAGLPVPRGDAELTPLVEALNRMLARLHDSHATELAFAAHAGHRLRTPVATLRAEAELALRETDPAQLHAALGRVVQDADQLTSIVDRMLARSRRDPAEFIGVRGAISVAGARWHRQAAVHGTQLTLVVDPSLPPSAKCPELLTVVEPVLDNAFRHCAQPGHVRVEVCLSGGDKPGVLVTVSNDGDPVPEELAPHIFDAWVSTRDASTTGGLGLWLARETARDVGGDVELSPKHDLGATFCIRLPLTTLAKATR